MARHAPTPQLPAANESTGFPLTTRAVTCRGAGRWEEAIGTCVVFTEEAPPAGEAGGLKRVRHAGHSETRLVMRPAPPAPLLLPPPTDAAAPAAAA